MDPPSLMPKFRKNAAERGSTLEVLGDKSSQSGAYLILLGRDRIAIKSLKIQNTGGSFHFLTCLGLQIARTLFEGTTLSFFFHNLLKRFEFICTQIFSGPKQQKVNSLTIKQISNCLHAQIIKTQLL